MVDPRGAGAVPELTTRLHDLDARLRQSSRCRAAARHARRTYPGPLGELVHRELLAYAEFGHRFGDGLVGRVVDELLGPSDDRRHG